MGGCECGKPKPGPNGNQKPVPPAKSLVASAGGAGGRITHVAPNGDRTPVGDMLAAKAAVVRRGGSVEFGS